MNGRYVILGGGAAGYAAAGAIRGLDPRGDITLVSDEPYELYSRPGLAYLLSGIIPQALLFSRNKEEDGRLRIRRIQGHALGLDLEGKQVLLQDRSSLAYDRVVLAVGSRAVRPVIPGIGLPGVVTLDTLQDALRILDLSRRAKRAVVVGGGITALELAEGLAAQGVEAHYFLRKDRYWGNVLDPSESELVEQRMGDQGIHLHRHTELAGVIGGKRVEGVVTQRGERLACQIVAVAVGISPRIELAVAAGIQTRRGILTDDYLRTSDEDVFAAGDAAEVLDPSSGAYRLESLWSLAIAQGRCAGENMAGAHKAYGTKVPFNVTRIGGVTTTIIGQIGQDEDDEDLVSIARGDSDTWRQRPEAFTAELDSAANRLRLVVGEHAILGAVVMGDQTLSRPLQHLIAERVDIAPIRSDLLHREKTMAEAILPYWRSLDKGGR